MSLLGDTINLEQYNIILATKCKRRKYGLPSLKGCSQDLNHGNDLIL